MSDRTFLFLSFRKCDQVAVEAELDEFSELNNSTDTWMNGFYYEIDYGGGRHLRVLATAKIPFFGHMGDGSEYAPFVVCSTGDGELYEHEGNREGIPVVAMTWDEEAMQARLGAARLFCARERTAQQIVEGMPLSEAPHLQACLECGQPLGGHHLSGCGKRVINAPAVCPDDCKEDDDVIDHAKIADGVELPHDFHDRIADGLDPFGGDDEDDDNGKQEEQGESQPTGPPEG
jgi:hypothetical protein